MTYKNIFFDFGFLVSCRNWNGKRSLSLSFITHNYLLFANIHFMLLKITKCREKEEISLDGGWRGAVGKLMKFDRRRQLFVNCDLRFMQSKDGLRRWQFHMLLSAPNEIQKAHVKCGMLCVNNTLIVDNLKDFFEIPAGTLLSESNLEPSSEILL